MTSETGMTEVPPLIEFAEEEGLVAVQSSLSAVARRIIVSSPIVLPPIQPAKLDEPLFYCARPVPGGPVCCRHGFAPAPAQTDAPFLSGDFISRRFPLDLSPEPGLPQPMVE
jgi:hypothetical protein